MGPPSRLNLNLEMLCFKEGGKDYQKDPWGKKQEPIE